MIFVNFCTWITFAPGTVTKFKFYLYIYVLFFEFVFIILIFLTLATPVNALQMLIFC